MFFTEVGKLEVETFSKLYNCRVNLSSFVKKCLSGDYCLYVCVLCTIAFMFVFCVLLPLCLCSVHCCLYVCVLCTIAFMFVFCALAQLTSRCAVTLLAIMSLYMALLLHSS